MGTLAGVAHPFSELADLVIPDNKHVSGCHCVLSKTPKATLKDTSTNGTLLNNKRVQRNVQVGTAYVAHPCLLRPHPFRSNGSASTAYLTIVMIIVILLWVI